MGGSAGMIGKVLHICLSALGGLLLTAFGGWDNFIMVLCVFIVIDIVLGLIDAIFFKSSDKTKSGAYKSAEMRKGLMRKVGILACVVVACMLDRLIGVDYLRNSVIVFFIINEGMSIIENVGLMGVPIPKAIVKAFAVLKDKYEIEDNDEKGD